MSDRESTVVTVQKSLSADVIKEKGIAVRFLGTDGSEYQVQLPFAEAHGLSEMITIALSQSAT